MARFSQFQSPANVNAAVIGEIRQISKNAIPNGWLQCDGSAISRATYQNLFDAIGTTYGVGDGSTTFNLPDLRGRVPLGEGQGPSLNNKTLGETGGEEEHSLTESELASHKHDAIDDGFFNRYNISDLRYATQSASWRLIHASRTDYSGSSNAHNNMTPYTVTRFIIKY